MDLSITLASLEEKPVVARLLQLCLHDHSTHSPVEIDTNGLFSYRWFDSYWSSPNRFPYLIRVGSQLAGFAFVRDRENDEIGDWQRQIAEFFILRGLRRANIGRTAALALLRSKCAVWEFAYAISNEPARLFWRQVALSCENSPAPIAVSGERECYRVTIKPETTWKPKLRRCLVAES